MGVSGQRKDRHDFYFEKARTENFRARSVYKLKEIQQDWNLIRPGFRVLDLGAAPGSWTQFAAQVVGSSGRVVSIDRQEIIGPLPSQVTCLQLDLLELTPQGLQELAGFKTCDVVLSDMAPNTSGIRSVDHLRSITLAEQALAIACTFLRPGGHFVCKVFQGSDLEEYVRSVRSHFRVVRRAKPKSSRGESVELFVVGSDFQPTEDGKSPA